MAAGVSVLASTEKSLGHPYPLLHPVVMAMEAIKPRVTRKNLTEDSFMIYNALIWSGFIPFCCFYNDYWGKIILIEPLYLQKVNRKGQNS
jgi:hypothetical protein